MEFRILNKNKDILDTYELPEEKDRKAFQPINLTAERYDYTEVHYPKPLIARCRYPVSLAIAKTLEEVTKEYIVHEIENTYEKMFTDNEQVLGTTQFDSIKKQLDEFVITAEIKHGGDGMGEIKVWKEKSESPYLIKLFIIPFALSHVVLILEMSHMCYLMKMIQILFMQQETFCKLLLMRMISRHSQRYYIQ